MMELLGVGDFFWKGIAITVAAVVLFIGSVYVLLTAVFGLRMAYLVLAVSFFGWMILWSAIWVFGPPALGTLKYLGPRGTEAHWEVFAAGTGPIEVRDIPEITSYPGSPWRDPGAGASSAVELVKSAVQKYMVTQAGGEPQAAVPPPVQQGEQAREQGFQVEATDFAVEDVKFATAKDGTFLAAAHTFFEDGGTRVTAFVRHDSGNVGAYSWAFFLASIVGFVVHIPLLDRAEKKRKAILTGGTAPPWYGPA
jgi:hypothetical protein